jgi:hypothetical protein
VKAISLWQPWASAIANAYFVEAFQQYYERPAAEAGPVEEINPAEMEIQIENEDGTWRDGSLAEVMPADGEPPQFVAWGECDCCGPKT